MLQVKPLKLIKAYNPTPGWWWRVFCKTWVEELHIFLAGSWAPPRSQLFTERGRDDKYRTSTDTLDRLQPSIIYHQIHTTPAQTSTCWSRLCCILCWLTCSVLLMGMAYSGRSDERIGHWWQDNKRSHQNLSQTKLVLQISAYVSWNWFNFCTWNEPYPVMSSSLWDLFNAFGRFTR